MLSIIHNFLFGQYSLTRCYQFFKVPMCHVKIYPWVYILCLHTNETSETRTMKQFLFNKCTLHKLCLTEYGTTMTSLIYYVLLRPDQWDCCICSYCTMHWTSDYTSFIQMTYLKNMILNGGSFSIGSRWTLGKKLPIGIPMKTPIADIHSSSKEMQLFLIHLSLWPWVRVSNSGSWTT